MKTITVGELRQNPTQMLEDVADGETYRVTRHQREVARIVPAAAAARLTPPRLRGPASTMSLARVELPTGMDFDSFLEDMSADR